MFTAIAIIIAFLGGVASARAGRGMITGLPFDPFDPKGRK
jgi:glycerate kinase